MTMLLDPNWQRGYLVPYGRDKRTGRGGMAIPGIVQDLLSALMLPGDVYKGNVLLNDPQTGRTSDEVIRRSADLAGMVTLGSGAIPAEANSLRMGIKAYHGSPHDFDRFDMGKVGTGEGAQAYGHGLYFAEKEGVAKSYRDGLAQKKGTVTLGGVTYKEGDDPLADYVMDIMKGRTPGTGYSIKKGLDEAYNSARYNFPEKEVRAVKNRLVEWMGSPARYKEKPGGKMYEVDINADPNDFLDWDKPLSEQPKLDRILALRYGGDAEKIAKAKTDEQYMGRTMGANMYDLSHEKVLGSPSAASESLKAAGIPGIKYLDAGSRGAGDGSRNYVVFDDKLISIVKKYGVAALVSAGVISQQQGEELKAQGYN